VSKDFEDSTRNDYPEVIQKTLFEEIGSDVPEADFGPMDGFSIQVKTVLLKNGSHPDWLSSASWQRWRRTLIHC
jgi:hypothetical protein